MNYATTSVTLLLSLVSGLSLAYRDGARTQSCYGHEIEHLSFGQPVPKLSCSGSCRYYFTFMGRVDENFQPIVDESPQPPVVDDSSGDDHSGDKILQPEVDNNYPRIECDNIYHCKYIKMSV